ncbi:MAG: helicase-related protein [Candidatus Xenobiia bacterium LiM19]
MNQEFTVNTTVAPYSSLNNRGIIIEMIPGSPENRYKVFINGTVQIFYASQLKAIIEDLPSFEVMEKVKWQAYLSACQIRNPGLSTLYSLNSARIQFIPYQFRPVLKFIQSDRPRLLIADSVGVGKTIEAGLILKELQARRSIDSILIICPRPLVIERKWYTEMRRFDERFQHLDSKTIGYCIYEMDIQGEWPLEYKKAIIPYSVFDEKLLFGTSKKGSKRKGKGLFELEPPPRFDLVIVDEAHHIRNTNTFVHRGVRYFCDNAEAVIFLTATPVQMGNEDLFTLLNVLRPDLILDKESFSYMAEPNPHINKAVNQIRAGDQDWQKKTVQFLNHALETSWGRSMLSRDPAVSQIINTLNKPSLGVDDRITILKEVEQLHTFSGIVNRTRRRDIGDFTVRKPETVSVEFTSEQRELHDTVLSTQREILLLVHDHSIINFLMSTIRRQVASCLFGLVPFLEEMLSGKFTELMASELDDTFDYQENDAIKKIELQIKNLIIMAKNLNPYDPKLEALRKIITNKKTLPNNKIILFSTFRHTLNYLYEKLSIDGIRVGLVHGDVSDEDRIAIRDRFVKSPEAHDALDMLLFSEIGCEGLDYQFCDCMVNYDLPWNPMRIEQRIGRIDRNGQQSETVAIYNFITPGTIDAEIYDRCLMRIGVFNAALGGSEEIMGEITREIKNVADNLKLTDKEREAKLQQIADNKIRLIKEQQELEERQLEIFSVRLPSAQINREIAEASSLWLNASALENMISEYLKKILQSEQEFIRGRKGIKTLRLSQEARSKLLNEMKSLPRIMGETQRRWDEWLKGGTSQLEITFDSSAALDNQGALHITPLHPLVQAAARYFKTDRKIVTGIKVSESSIPPGIYPFTVYEWHLHGIFEDLNLKAISDNEAVTEILQPSIETGVYYLPAVEEIPNEEAFDIIEKSHYPLWKDAREEHRRKTRGKVEFKKESLARSHKARIDLLNEQILNSTDEKIKRMRVSQIASAEADYKRRNEELESAMEQCDISSQPLAYGILRII